MTTTKEQHEFHPTVEEFLDTLNLPSRHPYIDDDEQSQEHVYTSETDITGTTSFMDHFLPAGSLAVETRFYSQPQTNNNNNGGFSVLPGATPNCQPGSTTPTSEDICTSNKAFPNESNFDTTIIAAMDFRTVVHNINVMVLGFLQEVGPSIVAASHLFFRLFCPAILVLALVILLIHQTPGNTKTRRKKLKSKAVQYHLLLHFTLSFIALVCCLVIATDEMYILEFGRKTLVGLYVLTAMLVYYRSPSWKIASALVMPITGIMIVVSTHCKLDLPVSLESGFYYDSTNPLVNAIATEWSAKHRQYTSSPWVVNGDTRTGIPFFLNSLPYQEYVRRWVPSNVPNEREAVILDIAFPTDGVYRQGKPLYLVLCGMSGGSQEEFVKDFVSRQTAKGSTVAVMVTRGLMDSPIIGDDLLHFARISDIDAAAKVLKAAAAPIQTVAGVGYSMGALSLTNYAARTGKHCQLDAIVSISGALDTREQLYFRRSERFWQPLIVKSLRDKMMRKFAKKLQKRLTMEQIKAIATAPSLVSFDQRYSVTYHGFANIQEYYSEMGAMGDAVRLDGSANEVGRIANISIPTLVLHAIDDPIGTPKTLWDPKSVSLTGTGNTMILLTDKGGHVGWPIGWNPASEAWFWMSNVASSFVETADQVFHRMSANESQPAHKHIPHLG